MKKEVQKINGQKYSRILLGLILALTVILYGRTTRFGFMEGWDDLEYIQNTAIQQANIQQIFSAYHLGMYQPLSASTLALNYQASAEKATSYHATNLILHLVNIILIFLLIARLGKRNDLALITALLFAVHPMNVEAIVWISARSTLLFTGFSLGALLCYIKYIEARHRWIWFIIATGLFILALLSKSMAMILPLLFLLTDWYLNGRLSLRNILEKIPLLGISVIFGLITIRASESFGHISGLSGQFSIAGRIILNCFTVILYIFKSILPVNLSAIYAFPEKVIGSLYYLSLIPAGLIIWLLMLKNPFRKELIYGILFFLISISVVLPLFWSRKFMAGERYTYFAFLGLFYLYSRLFMFLASAKAGRISRLVSIAGIVYIVFLAGTTFQRISVWAGTEELMQDVILKNRSGPASAHANYYLGALYFDRQDYQKAMERFNQAVKLKEDFAEAYNDRGILQGMAEQYGKALEDFNQAIKYDPKNPESYYNRGFAHYQLGMKTQACNDWHKALTMKFEPAKTFIQQYCN